MKSTIGLVAAMMILTPCAVQADAVWDGFPTNPGMTVVTGNPITARIPVATPGAVWTVQTSVSIPHWQHYAPLQIGVEGTGSDPDFIPNGWDQLSLRFSRGDDANRRASMWFYNPAAGWGWNPWQADPTSMSPPLEEGNYNAWLMGRPGGWFRAIVSDAGSVRWDSGWRFGGNFTDPTSLLIQVPNVSDQGYITYNSTNDNIDFYGYQGAEGWYLYDIEGSINGLGLVTGTEYDMLPQTSVKPSISQSAALVDDDYAANPGLTVAASGDYLDQLMGSRTLPGTYGGAFLFESQVGITLFNHYGYLRNGVKGVGTWSRACIFYQKADDGVERCVLEVHREEYDHRGPYSEPLPRSPGEPLVVKQALIYDPVKGVRGVVRSLAGELLYDSGWITADSGNNAISLDIDGHFMEVKNGNYPMVGGGSISYDAANSRMNFVSYVGMEGSVPYQMDGYVEGVALRYNVGSFASLPTYTSADWNTLADGAIGQFAASQVSVDVGDSFFVESPGRTDGIRVGKLATESYYPGSVASIDGSITTDANGERKIIPTRITSTVGPEVIPLGTTNKSIGGGPKGLQVGVTGASGLNNIGLLVTVWGKPSLAETTDAFMLTDGSDVSVRVQLPAGQTHSWAVDALPAYVTVTGAVGLKKTGSNYERVIYVGNFATDVR